MLYIKKKEAPRSMRAKVAEIKSSPAWKHIQLEDTKALRQQFDLLPKQDIRQALLDEQYFLCAYCMRRIENEELHMNIEHWSPLSKDKDNALNYRNFLAVCKGGADIPGNTKRRVLCCDAKKLDTELTIDPQDQEMMSHIRYNKDGIILFHPTSPSGRWTAEVIHTIEQDINQILQLNGRPNRMGGIDDTATCIVKGRKDAWESGRQIIQRLHKKGSCTPKQIQNEMERLLSESPRKPFVGVTVYYLRRKYRQLIHQNHTG